VKTPRSSRRTLLVQVEKFPLKAPFHVTGYSMTHSEVVTVTLRQGIHLGRGEAAGVYYRVNENATAIVKQIEAVRESIEGGIDRVGLQGLLHAGGARNALDCALWDLDAMIAGVPVWRMAGVNDPKPLLTTFTVGANGPEKMALDARAYIEAKAIKIKLTGDELVDSKRLHAVRRARPDVWLGVDANQGFTPRTLFALLPALLEARVSLIEQPFKVGEEPSLSSLGSPIPIAADESVQGPEDLAAIIGHFDIVNIKLDKCGGLTAALSMARDSRERDLGVMVGNMVGTSLAMAPAFVVGQLCDIVDLDGPALLSVDRTPAATYAAGLISCPADLWGHGGV
jgi:L-Ala-D/L-Glu epimerase